MLQICSGTSPKGWGDHPDKNVDPRDRHGLAYQPEGMVLEVALTLSHCGPQAAPVAQSPHFARLAPLLVRYLDALGVGDRGERRLPAEVSLRVVAKPLEHPLAPPFLELEERIGVDPLVREAVEEAVEHLLRARGDELVGKLDLGRRGGGVDRRLAELCRRDRKP